MPVRPGMKGVPWYGFGRCGNVSLHRQHKEHFKDGGGAVSLSAHGEPPAEAAGKGAQLFPGPAQQGVQADRADPGRHGFYSHRRADDGPLEGDAAAPRAAGADPADHRLYGQYERGPSGPLLPAADPQRGRSGPECPHPPVSGAVQPSGRPRHRPGLRVLSALLQKYPL